MTLQADDAENEVNDAAENELRLCLNLLGLEPGAQGDAGDMSEPK